MMKFKICEDVSKKESNQIPLEEIRKENQTLKHKLTFKSVNDKTEIIKKLIKF